MTNSLRRLAEYNCCAAFLSGGGPKAHLCQESRGKRVGAWVDFVVEASGSNYRLGAEFTKKGVPKP